jgi:hypothetical protein
MNPPSLRTLLKKIFLFNYTIIKIDTYKLNQIMIYLFEITITSYKASQNNL